jgi:DNA uptake protein ComE-like DNA-binding protein
MKESEREEPLFKVVREHPHERILPQGPHDGLRSTHAFEINEASQERLAAVDFVGDKLAHAIVEERKRRGGFRSWDEVASIAGMNAKRVAELQRSARLTPPEA